MCIAVFAILLNVIFSLEDMTSVCTKSVTVVPAHTCTIDLEKVIDRSPLKDCIHMHDPVTGRITDIAVSIACWFDPSTSSCVYMAV